MKTLGLGFGEGSVTLDVKKYGPAYNGGKMGFYQMAETVSKYSNFKVWELKE